MKSLATNNTHYPLKQTLYKTPQQQNTRSFRSEVTEIWQAIVAHLECTSEPRVWQTQDQVGQDKWNAYDPASRQTLRQVSAQDLRVWLEERHYQYSFSGDRTV
jgi:hypothetical protein